MIPNNKDLNNMLIILKMLQDETRLKIVFALIDSPKCVGEIVSVVGKTQSAISHQLCDMKESKLVTSKKIGNKAIYSLADAHVEQVVKLCLEHAKEF